MSESPKSPMGPYLRLAFGVVVALVLWLVLPATPIDQEVRLRLGEQSYRVERITLHARSVSQEDALVGARLYYPERAPRTVIHSLRLAPGEYDLWVELFGKGLGGDRTSKPTRVTLEGKAVTLPLSGLLQ